MEFLLLAFLLLEFLLLEFLLLAFLLLAFLLPAFLLPVFLLPVFLLLALHSLPKEELIPEFPFLAFSFLAVGFFSWWALLPLPTNLLIVLCPSSRVLEYIKGAGNPLQLRLFPACRKCPSQFAVCLENISAAGGGLHSQYVIVRLMHQTSPHSAKPRSGNFAT